MTRLTWIVAGAVLLSASAAEAATKVLVLPFAGSSADVRRDAWIGPAVQQNVVMTLGQAKGVVSIAQKEKAGGVVDAAGAARAARGANAALAVFGSYEVVDGQVRLTAQLVDASSGEPVGGARATGTSANLLRVEDQLAEQLRQHVGQQAAVAEAAREAANRAAAQAAENAQNAALQNRWDNTPVYPTGYYSNWGYSSWYWPTWGWGFWPGWSWTPSVPVTCGNTAWLPPGWTIIWNNGQWQGAFRSGGWWANWGGWNHCHPNNDWMRGDWNTWYPNATPKPVLPQPVQIAPPGPSRLLPITPASTSSPVMPVSLSTPAASRGGINSLPGSPGWQSFGRTSTPGASPARTLPVYKQAR